MNGFLSKTGRLGRRLLLAFLLFHTAFLQALVTWDQQSLIIDGHRVVPAMGEIHYSRIPAPEWERALQQMKDGGITMLACYVFWNHIEEIEGQYDWSGQRNLRRFLEVCKAAYRSLLSR